MTVIKTKELLESVAALRELGGLDLPVTLAFRLQRNMKRIQTEIDIAEELRKKIVDKFTLKDDKGEIVRPLDKDGNPDPNSVKLSDVPGYNAAIKELHAIEAKFTLDEIAPDAFGDKVTLKPSVLLALHWLFTEAK